MASLSLVVNVTVTKSTRVVSLQSFAIPLIMGPSDRFMELYRVYTDVSGMLSDGFLTSDPEYIHAQALSSQAIRPTKWVIGKNSAAVEQVDTFAVNTLTVGHQYKFTLNSIIISYTAIGGDTQEIILAALLAAIGTAFPTNPPVTGAVTGAGAGALLTLTSTVPGLGFSLSAIDADLTHASVTANHSMVQDLQALQLVIAAVDQFYGVLITSKIKSDILQMAAYIETQLLVYVCATLDADTLTSVTTDVMSILHGFGYDRTMILYSAQANTNAPDAAWVGYLLPTTPGSSNWADKVLVGVTPDNLNDTQIGNVLSKKGNIYVPQGGAGNTLFGTSCGGEYFDITIFLDWLASTMQANIFAVVTNPLNLKIPYTNQGIGQIENPIHQTMQQGQDNGGLAPGWTVFAPDAASVPTADKANRVLNNIGASGTLAGAINTINVNVYASV